jgi:mannose/cellobiose epimerase-like protein (N-acyl-D-glucosamine 2-epimerase family)
MNSFLSILLLITVLPIFQPISSSKTFYDNQGIQEDLQIFDINPNIEPSIDRKLKRQSQNNDPELYFPTFLFYSIEVANLLIENLYDNDSNVFHSATVEEWDNNSINTEKRTYDNAQAILGLLKLADAVINETERDFALNIAEKTGNGLMDILWDPDFDGLFVSDTDRYKKPGVHGKAIQAFIGGLFVSDTDRYKKPGVHGKAIQAFIGLYEETDNPTFRDMALNTFNFLDATAWNDTKGYYHYVTSHTGSPLDENPYPGDLYEPQSLRVDHNAIMGNALLNLYRMESNETYLTKAVQIFDIINATCRNTSTNLFYTGVDTKEQVVVPDTSDIFINSLVLEFLFNLYNVTEDMKYYEDFFPLLNSVLLHFWDNNYGGFIATSSSINSSFNDETKYTERQFYGILALDKAYELTDSNLYYNLILDTVEILNAKLYDQVNGGYYQLSNPDGTQGEFPSWRWKTTVTQSLAIYSLANLWLYSKPGVLNVLWSPSTPRPQDRVTLITAAFDLAGISTVFLNYSIGNSDYELKEMVPHSVGNMFNVTLDPPHPDGTTINFNILVNDTLGNQTIRGDYSFLWQTDIWPPNVQEIGFLPGVEVPVNEEFSVYVSAQDVPTQGTVKYIRFHYHRTGGNDKSLSLEQTDIHIWKITFSDGLSTPGTYAYYFESIDNELNPGFSHVSYFYILGQIETPPLMLIIGLLVVVGVVVPAGLYTFIEYKKKSARTTLKEIKNVRHTQRGRKLKKRGTRRT